MRKDLVNDRTSRRQKRNVVNFEQTISNLMLEFVWTIEEAAAFIGVSRAEGYARANNGEIPVIEIGGRILVPKQRLLRAMERGKHDRAK